MNIHLITSGFNRLIDMEIKKIIKDNEFITLNMISSDYNLLYEECSFSFFNSEMKYIVVKNFFSKAKETEESWLLKYLEKPNKLVTLIFVEPKVDSRKKIIKTIKNNYSFISLEVDYKNIYEIVNNYIKENKYTYEYKVSSFLVNLYSSNIDLIFSELDKVFMYYGKPIMLNVDNIKDIVSTPFNSNNFKFIEAIINKDIKKAHEVLEDLIICKTEITSLIVLLAREYRLIYCVKDLYEKRVNLKEISKTLKVIDWQVEKYYKYSISYTKSELKSLIKELAEYDCKIKTGRLEKNSAIQLFMFNII